MERRFVPWDVEVRIHREGKELYIHNQNPSGPEAWLSGQVCQAWLPLFWRWVLLRRCLSLLCKWTSAVPAPPALQTCPEISEPWLWLNPCFLPTLPWDEETQLNSLHKSNRHMPNSAGWISLLTSGITRGCSSFLLPPTLAGKENLNNPYTSAFLLG